MQPFAGEIINGRAMGLTNKYMAKEIKVPGVQVPAGPQVPGSDAKQAAPKAGKAEPILVKKPGIDPMIPVGPN